MASSIRSNPSVFSLLPKSFPAFSLRTSSTKTQSTVRGLLFHTHFSQETITRWAHDHETYDLYIPSEQIVFYKTIRTGSVSYRNCDKETREYYRHFSFFEDPSMMETIKKSDKLVVGDYNPMTITLLATDIQIPTPILEKLKNYEKHSRELSDEVSKIETKLSIAYEKKQAATDEIVDIALRNIEKLIPD